MKSLFLALAVAMTLLGALCAHADVISAPVSRVDPPPSGIKEMYSIPFEPLSTEDRITVETLQGIVNRSPKPRLWLRWKSFYTVVEGQLRREGVKFNPVGSVQELLPIFKNEIKGVILYKSVDSSSLNPACSLCGPMDAIAVDEAQLPMAQAQGLKVLVDARSLTDAQVLDKYRSLFTTGQALELGKNVDHMRDYVAKHNIYCYAAGSDEAFRVHVLKTLGPNPAVYGVGFDEYPWIKDISLANGSAVATDWQIDLSVMEDLPAGPLKQPKTTIPKAVPGYHYVAFLVTDGDNIQWLSGGFVDYTPFWASPLRGKFPISWGVSPYLATLEPRLLQYLYSTATPNDDIINGPGQPGAAFTHFQPDKTSVAAQTEPLLRACDLHILNFNNDKGGNMTETIPFMKLPSVTGAVYDSYDPYKYGEHGKIFWYKGKPCVSFRCWLQEHITEPEGVADVIAATSADAVHDENSYSIVTLCAWSYWGMGGSMGGPLDAVQKTISLMPSNTKVVTVSQMIGMLKQNFGAKHRKP